MEQLFAVRPNFLTEDINNESNPKTRSSIIDKYIEFRMKLTEHDRLNKLKREESETDFSELLEASSVQNFLNNYQENTLNSVLEVSDSNVFYREEEPLGNNDEAGRGKTLIDSSSNEEQNIEEDVDSRAEKFIKKYKYDTGSEKDEWLGEQIEEREECEAPYSDEDDTAEVSNRVARILNIIQGYEPKEYLDDDAYDDDERLLTSRQHHFTYSAFFVMVFIAFIATILRKVNTIFEAVKVLFDTVFTTYWNWAKRVCYPGENNETNLVLFVLSTPVLGFLVIMYAGFHIMYVGNKALLLRVPDRVSAHLNLNSMREIQY